jgi:hypothetical protein
METHKSITLNRIE